VVCFDQDVFVNAVGGVKIAEPAADLAVLLAIVRPAQQAAAAGWWCSARWAWPARSARRRAARSA
jgi:hypothetical protein